MSAPKSNRRPKGPPKPATPQSLTHAAEYYVARFQATESMLRDVLMRRIRRTEALLGLDEQTRTQLLAAVDDICVRYRRVGLIDDAAYAQARARTLFERGTAPGQIRRRLALKGVSQADADAAVDALGQLVGGDFGSGDTEHAACIRLAKRRGFGPFNRRGTRTERRYKDLAALARAGFGYDVALAVVDAETAEDLLQVL